jgi:hypothetical protein
MLKRLWKALNDNALEIHQLHTGEKTFEDLKEPIPAVMFCQHCWLRSIAGRGYSRLHLFRASKLI